MEILFKAGRVRIVSCPSEYSAFGLLSGDSKIGFFGKEGFIKPGFFIEFDNVSQVYLFLGWLIFEANYKETDVNLFRKKLVKFIMDNHEFLAKGETSY